MLRRSDGIDEVIEYQELSYGAERHGVPVTVRLALRHPSQEVHFHTVDLLAPRPRDADPFAGLRSELAQLPENSRLGLTGVVLPSEDQRRPPVIFTVSVVLTDRTAPGDLGAEGDIVTPCVLAGSPGQRHAEMRTLEGTDGAQLPLLTVTYATVTEDSTLVLTFGTPCVGALDAFMLLFDAIAASAELS